MVRTNTGGRAESGYHPAVVETARIVNVNSNDYTVDAVSEYGNRRFFDIQVMSPYFHYFNGEGWYAMPEVGAMCWVCQESSGYFAKHFILGFQAPFDERTTQGGETQAGNYKSNRQTLNQGDMMWRGRDENFVILRRGGVVQIGSGPATQRIYVPLGGLIRDFCFGYELQTLSGDLKFINDREDQDDAGQVKTRFQIRAKTRANDKDHAVVLVAGSHTDNDDLRLSLLVNESGVEGAPTVATLQIDKNGSVTWTLKKDFSMVAEGAISMTAKTGDFLLAATKGAGAVKAGGSLLLESTGDAVTLKGKKSVTVKGQSVSVEGTAIALKGKTQVGGPGGEPIPKGLKLVDFMTQFILLLTDPSKPAGITTAPGTPIVFPGLTALLPLLPQLISTNNTTT